MNAILSIQDSKMATDDLQALTFDLWQDITKETDMTAKLPEECGRVGMRGNEFEIGQILLAALSSGTVVAMFQVLKSYIERKPALKIEIEAADGSKMKIDAEHLSNGQIEQTIQTAKQFCGA